MISHPSVGHSAGVRVWTVFKRNLVQTMEVGQLRKEDKLMYTKFDSVDRDDVIMKRIEKRVWDSSYDLVKSHLMFAVREEVEVLKEQIKELMERTGQLEYENGILRAAASPETLAQLAQPRQQPPSSSS